MCADINRIIRHLYHESKYLGNEMKRNYGAAIYCTLQTFISNVKYKIFTDTKDCKTNGQRRKRLFILKRSKKQIKSLNKL